MPAWHHTDRGRTGQRARVNPFCHMDLEILDNSAEVGCVRRAWVRQIHAEGGRTLPFHPVVRNLHGLAGRSRHGHQAGAHSRPCRNRRILHDLGNRLEA